MFYFKTISAADVPGGTLTRTSSADKQAIFMGTSGQSTVHYIDDCSGIPILVASQDTGNFPTYINSIFNIPRDHYIPLDIDYYNH